MTPYILKPATTEGDWQQVKTLLSALLAFEKSLRPERKETARVIEGAFRYMCENIAARQGLALLAVDEAGMAIGFMNGWIDSGDGLDQGDNRVGYISDAFILPERRNAYLFKKLCTAMGEHFSRLGVERMSFDTLGSNLRMQRLFIAAGYLPHKIVFEIPLTCVAKT